MARGGQSVVYGVGLAVLRAPCRCPAIEALVPPQSPRQPCPSSAPGVALWGRGGHPAEARQLWRNVGRGAGGLRGIALVRPRRGAQGSHPSLAKLLCLRQPRQGRRREEGDGDLLRFAAVKAGPVLAAFLRRSQYKASRFAQPLPPHWPAPVSPARRRTEGRSSKQAAIRVPQGPARAGFSATLPRFTTISDCSMCY